MITIRLDGAQMTSRKITHEYLKKKLMLPDYYGENLDALWDCLSSDFSPKRIILVNPEQMRENLADYGDSILKLFAEIAEQNKATEVVFRQKKAGRQQQGQTDKPNGKGCEQ